MLIFAIDDEPRLLSALHKAIAGAKPEAEIRDYALGTEAIRDIKEHALQPDVVFTDIRMPELDGLALAVKLKELVPNTKIVFVTGYEEYALDAFRVHASGYVTKPVETERIREELENILPVHMEMPDGLWVRCFGSFEVFWNKIPVSFGRRKTKELLAYLIDKEGGICTAEELVDVLWEGTVDMKAGKARLRMLINDLKNTLTQIGEEDILVRRSGGLSLLWDRIPCDYYYMLCGDMRWGNSYFGEYMSQYSWAEITRGKLHFRLS